MKLFRAGVPNEDLFTLLAENVRNPAQVLGDVHSFVAANAVGAERLTAFMSEYGIHDLEALAAVLQGRSEKAMREAIAALPDGVYTSEVWNNPLGTPLRYPVKLTVKGDTIEVDFEGAPPQLPQGGLNCTLNYTASHATYPLKCMLTPNVRGNAGCYRAFTVKAPEGSALNCDKPMAVNLRTRTGWYIAPNIFTALAKAAPGRVQAATGLPVAINDLRPRRRGADLFGSSVHGRRAGRLGSGRRRVGAAVADLARRTPRSSCSSSACRCWSPRRPMCRTPAARAAIAAASASASACASSTATACRRSPRSIPKASASRCRACSAASPAAPRAAWCATPPARSSRIAAPGSSSRPRPIRRSSRCVSRAAPASARRSSARSRRSRAISPKATSRRRPPRATTAW